MPLEELQHVRRLDAKDDTVRHRNGIHLVFFREEETAEIKNIARPEIRENEFATVIKRKTEPYPAANDNIDVRGHVALMDEVRVGVDVQVRCPLGQVGQELPAKPAEQVSLRK